MKIANQEFVNAVMNDDTARAEILYASLKDLHTIEAYEGMLLTHYIIYQKQYKMFRCFLKLGLDLTSSNNHTTNFISLVRNSMDTTLIEILEQHLGKVKDIEEEVAQTAAARDFSDLKEKAIADEQKILLKNDAYKSVPIKQLKHVIIDLFTAEIEYSLFCEEFIKLDDPFIYSNERNETLIHLAVKFRRYDILSLIVCHELFYENCKSQNAYGKTALHMAVISGDLEAYKILVKDSPKQCLAKCSNGLTILHYVAQYGHLSILTEMLFGVLEVGVLWLFDICDDNGKFALHYASSQNISTECLEILLEKETRAIAIDAQRNTPLHYAAIHGISRNVQLLLEAGFSPYQKNSTGKSPLDLAIELGHHDIADLMIQKPGPYHIRAAFGYMFSSKERIQLFQVDQHILKTQNDQAVALLTDIIFCAKDSSNCQLEVFARVKAGKNVLFDINTDYLNTLYPKRLLSEFDWNSEVALLNLLEESIAAKEFYIAVKCLKYLGDICLAKEQFNKAAKFYNSSLVLYQQSGPSNRIYKGQLCNPDELFLHQCISSVVQKLSLSLLQIGIQYDYSRIQKYRQMLFTARRECVLNQASLSQQNQQIMTQCYRTILSAIVGHYSQILNLDNHTFSILLCGSVARNETSLYSDIEYIILTIDDNPLTLSLCEKLARFIELDIINMQETEFKILKRGQESISKPGFCLDPHGITPRGRVDPSSDKTLSEYKLIGSPSATARLVSGNNFLNERELVVSLCTTSYLLGNATLAQTFIDEVCNRLDNSDTLFNRVAQFFAPKLTLRAIISQQCLLALTDEFQPRLDQVKNQEKFFMIKQELYRILERFISSLAMLTRCSAYSAWQRLDYFVEKKILTAEASDNLRNALNLVLLVRCRVQNHYKSEFDGVWHLRSATAGYILPNNMNKDDVYLLSKVDIEDIQAIYSVLLSITEAIKKLVACNYNLKTLSDCPFKSKLNQARARYFSALYDYEHANDYFEKSIALNPNDASVIARYIGSLHSLGQYQKAITIGLEAIDRWEQQGNTYTLEYLQLLSNLTVSLYDGGRVAQAREMGLKAYQTVNLVAPTSAVAHAVLIALMSITDDEHEKIKQFELCEKIEQLTLVDPQKIASRIVKKIELLLAKKEYTEALELIETAKEIVVKSRFDSRVELANLLGYKARVLYELGLYKEAYRIYDELHQLHLQIYGEYHVLTESSYVAMAGCECALGDFVSAIEHCEKAININMKISPHPNELLGVHYNKIADVYRDLKKYKEAIFYEKKAVSADKAFYGDDHINVAIRLGDLAAVALNHDMEIWDAATEEALKIMAKKNPSRVDDIFHNVTVMLTDLKDYHRAIKYCQLWFSFSNKDEKSPVLYYTLATCYLQTGQIDKFRLVLQKLLSLQDVDPSLLSNLAVFLRHQQMFEDAVSMHLKAIAFEERLNGPKSVNSGKFTGYLGDTYSACFEYRDAEAQYQRAIEIFRANFNDNDHFLIQTCLSKIEETKQHLPKNYH